MMKLREEFDYKSLCRKLETDLDRLIAENERQTKMIFEAEEEMQRKAEEAQTSVLETEKRLQASLEVLPFLFRFI